MKYHECIIYLYIYVYYINVISLQRRHNDRDGVTSVSIVYSTICWGADKKHTKAPRALAFVREIHRWPVDSPHKGPVMRKMFPLNVVFMIIYINRSKQPILLFVRRARNIICASATLPLGKYFCHYFVQIYSTKLQFLRRGYFSSHWPPNNLQAAQ